MKLLQCRECGHVFSIGYTSRSCECGRVSGWYEEDGWHARYHGPATLIGFHNAAFRKAKHEASVEPTPDWGKRFEAFVICPPCPTFRRSRAAA